MSIDSVVATITKDYVKPKYPIFRVSYVHMFLDPEREMQSDKKCDLFEITEEDNVQICSCCPKLLGRSILDDFKQNDIVCLTGGEDEEYLIYKMEQVA